MESGKRCYGCEHGPHKAVVAAGGFESPFSRTAKQDAIDIARSATEKPIVQLEASIANWARKRAMAASCKVSLSAWVVTVT
jgi:hypothetical protein